MQHKMSLAPVAGPPGRSKRGISAGGEIPVVVANDPKAFL